MRSIFLLVLLLCPVLGMAQYGHLLHRTHAARYRAIDSLFFAEVGQTDSVTFFRKLEKLAETARTGNDPELELEAEFLRGEYYMVGQQHNRARFVPHMLAMKKQADDLGLGYLQVRTRQKLGYYYFYIVQRFGPGFENLLQAHELLQKIPDAALPEKQELVADLGTAYYTFGELETAGKYFNQALKIPPSYKKRVAINIANTLGLIASNQKKPDSAEFFYNRAYKMAQGDSDSVWMGIVSGNKAMLLVKQKRYAEAIPMLELDVAETLKANEVDNAVASLTTLAQIHLEQRNLATARALTRQALGLLPRTGEPHFHLKDLYKLQADLHYEAGNFALAYAYADSGRATLDSIYVRRRKQLHQLAQNKIAVEQYRNEVLQQKQADLVRNLWAGGISGAIAGVSILAIYLINRQRIRLKQKQRGLQTEKEAMAAELAEARRQLGVFTDSIREKNQIIEQYAQQTHRGPYGEDPDQEARQNTLNLLMQATLLTDAQWLEFTRLFEKVHTGYLTRLKEQLPQISPADTRYIVLSKLGLAPKEMAAMLGVRPDAVRLYKHRLRKKLQLSEGQSLEEVLENL